MFCSASQKLLHRRSHKKLRDAETPASHHHHKRQNSAWSDSSRASSSSSGSDSSSSSSSRRDGSTVEWDPLRLHPSMAAPEQSPPRCVERRYQHQEEAEEKHHRLAHNRQPGFSLEIYDGFDFGFGAAAQKKLPAAVAVVVAEAEAGRTLRAPSSEADLRHQQRHSSPDPAEWGSESQPPSPSRRRPLPASLNEADYFLKRGGWKRRGIVFCTDEPVATDDDVFEIP
ncbi:uncharacterized protein E0L32_005613 [Thyridium curvatum]|uniref:Uncharacterized protein n=1 Tax=Thyridium curvatum TaxID=1093900 RepID=A0A507B211_9PEZI|nr:uncharacterized protein E0L32_005613 [Thyridium curvatum]TPX13913.1 hypothetical protein E0L32_005613 [Thyridium curvatum]